MGEGYPTVDLEQSLPPLGSVWQAFSMAHPPLPANAAEATTSRDGDGGNGEASPRKNEKIDISTPDDVEAKPQAVWLVSACLLGTPCRYDGQTAKAKARIATSQIPPDATIVACCPEQEGGLATPRPAAHLVGGDGGAALDGTARVVTENGVDVTKAFLRGARNAAALAQEKGATHALLKARSPSCGSAQVYLAPPHGALALAPGEGVTAALLRRRGLVVLSDEEILSEASQDGQQEVDAQPKRKQP